MFRAFARVVDEAERGFVVIDTAPTGHTLLLLDAAEAYHREVLRTAGNAPDEVRRLLPRLRDPAFTRILLVTLPEATPVHEAAALQRDLERAEIQPFAWVVNQSLSPLPVSDPVLAPAPRPRGALPARGDRRSRHALCSSPGAPTSLTKGARLDDASPMLPRSRHDVPDARPSAPSPSSSAPPSSSPPSSARGSWARSLAGGNVAIALLANTIATGAGLVALDPHVRARQRRPLQPGRDARRREPGRARVARRARVLRRADRRRVRRRRRRARHVQGARALLRLAARAVRERRSS